MPSTGTPSNDINTAPYTSGAEIKAADHSVPHADVKAKYAAHTHSIGSQWGSIHSSQEWVLASGTTTGTSSSIGAINETIAFAADADQGDPSFLGGAGGAESMHLMFSVRCPSLATVYFIGYSHINATSSAGLIGRLVYDNGGAIETKESAIAYEIDWIVVGRRS